MVIARIGREYISQIFAFGVTIFDRLVLTGILVRLWGVDLFAAWTVALSVAGMITIFDFGMILYFGNRLFFAVEQEHGARGPHILRAGNFALSCASVFGVVAVTSLYLGFGETVGGVDERSTLLWSIIALAAATGVRQSIATQYSVYRAHQQFFRQTMIFSLGDLLRLCAVFLAVIMGGGLLVVSLTYFAAMVVFSVLLPIWDTGRLFPAYRYKWEIPDKEEQRSAISTSFLYWVQSVVATLITFAPIFVLGAMKTSAFAIAQFALMRTLANFVRAILQLFANVFGLEAARRIATRDEAGLAKVYRESTRLLAVQMAGAAGGLLALAHPLFALWTGNPQLYDVTLFWLAICAPLALPTLSMALQILVCANMPMPLLYGRIAQVCLTIPLFLFLPVTDTALRMMIALAVGEVVGLGLPLTSALAKVVPSAGVSLHLDLLGRSLFVGMVTYSGARLATWGGGEGSIAGFGAGAFTAAVIFCCCTWILGLESTRRRSALNLVRSLFSR